MFSAAWSSAFRGSGVAAGFVCPVMAQAALVGGAAWGTFGAGVVIGGMLLIGPAGKVYEFASVESAARWVDNARAAGVREAAIIASVAPEVAAAWKAKKRAKLAVIAGRLVTAAARMGDPAKRAALVAESSFCLSKW